MSEFVRKNLFTLILSGLVILMGVEIMYLVRQNRQLRAELAAADGRYTILQRDDRLPPVHAITVQGDSLNLSYTPDDPPTLLLWFSPSCEACDKNFEFWNRLASQSNAGDLRVVAFSSGTQEEAAEFLSHHEFTMPVVAVADETFLALYKGEVVPQTVLISQFGVVLQAWPGSLDSLRQNQISQALDSLIVVSASERR